MLLWRKYLEQYADKEGDIEAQTIIAAYYSVQILSSLSQILDRNDRYKELIDQRFSIFLEGSRRATAYVDCLLNATFSIYNGLNTLSHQLTEGNMEAANLIRTIDEQVRRNIASGDPLARPAAALRACFPLLGLITIASDENHSMTQAIRHVEQRFTSGAQVAVTDWDHLLNALYRMVEMVQIFALLTDAALQDQIDQIASRFKEEDQTRNLPLKLRNGFCRLFEFAHILAAHVDAMLT